MKFYLAIFVLAFFLCLFGWAFMYFEESTMAFVAARDSIVQEVAEEKDNQNIFFLGDIMLARDVEKRLRSKTPAYAFEELQILKEADYVLGNFEASIPPVHVPTPDFAMKFSVDPEMLEVIEVGGVTHLSLANNHALDYFEEGYRHTIGTLKSRGFEAFGHPLRVNEESVSYVSIDGHDIALISLNATYGELPDAWMEVLETASEASDTQIAYIHWGPEYELTHSESQETLGHDLIDAGFDVVIGHHPHVVQNVEHYKNGIIFYSLGNFIFDQYWDDDVSEGLALELILGTDSLIFRLHPVETKTTRVKPRLMVGEEKNAFLDELSNHSSPTLKAGIKEGVIALQF